MNDSEAPLVFPTTGGLCVRYRDRLLYSEREPSRLPRRIAAACDPGPGRIHLVLSPLLWYGIEELLAAAGPGSTVLGLEADPQLAALARKSLRPELLQSGAVSFLESSSAEEMVRAAASMGRFRAVSVVPLSGGEALNAKLYRRVADLLKAEIESGWRNRAALMLLGRRWARNILENLAQLPELDVRRLPRYPGAAIVCGAGPSLESALPFMAEHREALAVLATDTSLGSLLQAGIEPDLVICLEAQAHNLADFVPLGSRRLPLLGDISSHPGSFRAVAGPKHLSFVSLAESPFLDRLRAALASAALPFRPMQPLGSVGVHAVDVARAIAGGPVFASGLDFSFEVGKTHARGSPSLLAEERKLRRLHRWQNQLAISFRERNIPAPCPPLPEGPALLSDPVLLSYARLLGDTASAEGAVLLDIRGRGPSLGIRTVDLKEAGKLLHAASHGNSRSEGPRCAPGHEAAGSPGELAAHLLRFTQGELDRIRLLKDSLKGRRRNSDEELCRAVIDLDYLYWSFPDGDRAVSLARDFLNRLLPEIDFWEWKLSETRSALETLAP
ncbi:MAG TPA: 6-hydroxymethylpterin diphosphokinase MptE-like protein [Rectinemataceae bacterium]|nr:6-hydroxymethylpterin diphosphokinase MptE-like protein [Rectinemataceae bacterium]